MTTQKTRLRLKLFLLLACASFLILPQIASTANNSRPSTDKNRHSSNAPAPLNSEQQARAASGYDKLPLQFEVNRGQADKRVRFLSRGSGYNLFLTETEAVVALHRKGADSAPVVRLKLDGANRRPRIEGQKQLAGYSNYFTGDDPARWRTAIPTYERVAYSEVYPGIDVVYYGNQRQLEYDFQLAAGADPQRIKLDINGADSLKLDAEGNLLIETASGSIIQRKPVAYQELNGTRQSVRCVYELNGQSQVTFNVGQYDRTRPLVIDPTLAYSSYLGGSGNDEANAVAVDSSGAVYLTGNTESYDFLTTAGSFKTVKQGSRNAFITKLNPAGALVYSTYLGGSGSDDAFAIATDASGAAYVTGQILSYNFPLTAHLGATGVPGDLFVTKLSPNGSGLIYSTAIGGTRDDVGYGIAVDANGNASVAGRTYSNNFPVAGAIQPSKSGSINEPDGFVLKLNQTGTGFVFSTFLGGTYNDQVMGLALDAQGNILVTGLTASANFPTTANAFQFNNAGLYDAFVSKLPGDGSTLLYSTYLGGSGNDEGRAIAVDAQGAFYVAGDGDSFNFPTTAGVYQPQSAGSIDVFVAKFGASGSMAYNTLVGGAGMEFARGIAVDSSGAVYVCGETASANYPTTPGALQNYSGGSNDAFLTRLNPSATFVYYSTYLGGNLEESGAGVALDSSSNVYMTGYTASSTFNTTPGALQQISRGLKEAFIVKLAVETFHIFGRVTDTNGNGLANVTLTLSGDSTASTTSDAGGFYRFQDLPAGGSYTVTAALADYEFVTPSVTINPLMWMQNVDFTGAYQRFNLFGQTTDSNGNPLAGAEVTVKSPVGGPAIATATTDAAGYYRFFDIAKGDYIVTPTLTDYLFAPQSKNITLNGIQFLQFVGTYQRFDIIGRASNTNGDALPDVTITITGTESATTTTNVSGFYAVRGLKGGGTYTITPSVADYAFTPQSTTIAALNGNQIAEFTGVYQRHDIIGRIASSTGEALGNVTVSLTGPENATTTTDVNGFYRFLNVRDGGPYTIRPTLTDYAFTPQSTTISSLNGNQIAEFTGIFQRHDIFGRVASNNGTALAGVLIALSGPESGTATTDANGFYRFTNVHDGGPYTLTPSLVDYIFAPQSQTVSSLASNTPVEFTGIYQRFDIVGRLTDSAGNALAGASVSLSDSQPSVLATSTTDANGFYGFHSIAAGGPYTITPSLAYYNFTPQSLTIASFTENRFVDFTGVRQAYDIAGRVLDNAGNPLVNAAVTLSGAQSATTTTDASGSYVFHNLSAGLSYTLTPALTYYNLAPQSNTVNPLDANRTVDFTATRQTFEINGCVTDAQGAPLGGVTVNLMGAQEATTTTDASGYYFLRNLPAGYSYTVSPFGAYHDYSPASSTVNPLTSNRSIDFTGTRQRYVVDGFVKDLVGNPLSNATVTLSGGQTATMTTNVNGYFRFDGVQAGYSYTVAATLAYYTINPQSIALGTLSFNRLVNFTATRQVYSLGGRVTDSQGAALGGIVVNLSGAQSGSVQTDQNGNYNFAGLPAGYSYTVTPVVPGHSISPQSATANPLAQNSTANFTATRNQYTITGRATDACGVGMGGVTVTLSGGKSLTTMTDPSGNYSFTGLPSLLNYTVMPTRTGFTLTPASAQFNNLLANQSGVNFTAWPATTTVNPLADAYVYDNNPNTNFGTVTPLITRTRSGSNNQAFLKFDLTNFCNASRVVLRVYGRLSDAKMTSLALDVYGVPTTTWSETTLTWNNRPANSATVQQTAQVAGTIAKWYDLDITTYVKAELAAGRRTISLLLKNATTSSNNSTTTLLDSREATNKPQLVVTVP